MICHICHQEIIIPGISNLKVQLAFTGEMDDDPALPGYTRDDMERFGRETIFVLGLEHAQIVHTACLRD